MPVPSLRDLGRPVDVLWIDGSATPPTTHSENIAIEAIAGSDDGHAGDEEKCAGECARLVGEKGLFDTLHEQNMTTFGKYEFGSLLTSDPHAFDAFRFVYPALGLGNPVDHTTPFVASRSNTLRPRLTKELGYKPQGPAAFRRVVGAFRHVATPRRTQGRSRDQAESFNGRAGPGTSTGHSARQSRRGRAIEGRADPLCRCAHRRRAEAESRLGTLDYPTQVVLRPR